MKRSKAPVCSTEEEFQRELKIYHVELFRTGFYGTILPLLPTGVSLILALNKEPVTAMIFCGAALIGLMITPSLEEVMRTRPVLRKEEDKHE